MLQHLVLVRWEEPPEDDEFPFGEAKEGGAPGDKCAKVIPNLGNGERHTYALNDAHVLDPASPCVQAHVTPDEKQFADAQLADGFKDLRVIDADQFELTFSLPDTGPQVSCLNDPPPVNSLPNGDGWFRNTTEAVPLVNQTEPACGGGFRPTRAQACLGLKTKKGTGTSNPVTGMKHRERPRRKGHQQAHAVQPRALLAERHRRGRHHAPRPAMSAPAAPGGGPADWPSVRAPEWPLWWPSSSTTSASPWTMRPWPPPGPP